MKLKLKDRGPRVKDVQERLLKIGYKLGPTGADGNFGPLTWKAVKLFQQKNGLEPTGVVDDNTYRLLVHKSYRLGERLLYLHYPYLEGNDVYELQKSLKSLGFNPGPLDAVFGSATEKALREFQLSVGIQPDGILGPVTLKKLNDLIMSLGHSSVVDYPARDVNKSPLANIKVAIDAGHGGNDPGAVSLSGLKESEIVRDICKRVETGLHAKGAQVTKTYSDNRSISLQRRAEIANKNKCHLFVSIHLNAAQNASSQGTETLYFQKEQSFSRKGKQLAVIMQKELVNILRRADRGIKGRNLTVLKKTLMPAVIVEPLFITNPAEEALLKEEEWRQRIAMAICRGIETYFKTLKK